MESNSERPHLLARANKMRPTWRVPRRQVRSASSLRASRLVENFSEFIASRNVINRYSSYDKIVDGGAVGEPQAMADFQPDTFRALTESERHNQHRNQHQRSAVSKFPTSSPKKSRVKLMIRALFTPSQKVNKTLLLIDLLRAPVVLAAIFSLVLAASLLVLYAMSFHHCLSQHMHLEEARTSRLHVINSRHLADNRSSWAQSEPLSAFERALSVQTECAKLIGQPEEGAFAFKGIPYASPPVGPRRWQRPQPVWLDQNLCRPQQEQHSEPDRAHCAQLEPNSHRFTGQEDCLYLDVFAPRLGDPLKVSTIAILPFFSIQQRLK